VAEGEFAVVPANPTIPAGYTAFEGWTVGGILVNVASYAITVDTTFVAVFTPEQQTGFTATFNANGGQFASGSVTSLVVDTGEYVAAPVVTRANHIFAGWLAQGTTFVPNANGEFEFTFAQNITFVAQWTFTGGSGGNGGNGGNGDGGGGNGPTVPQGAAGLPQPGPGAVQQAAGFNTAMFGRFIFGFEDGTVRPNASVTRAEAAMIIFRLVEDPAKYDAVGAFFSDVAGGSWYAQAVNYLASIGVLEGYPDGTFRPNATITRAELAAVVTRFSGDNFTAGNIFTDVANHWAISYIDTAFNNGWIVGYPDGSFRPDAAMTRAEMVAMTSRVIDRAVTPGEINFALAGQQLFGDLTQSHWAFYEIMDASIDHEVTFLPAGDLEWSWFALPVFGQ
jgi:hypothetical protein